MLYQFTDVHGSYNFIYPGMRWPAWNGTTASLANVSFLYMAAQPHDEIHICTDSFLG